MTKALYCGMCGSIASFRRSGAITACECWLTVGWWVDARKGIAKLHGDRTYSRILGIHNGYLRDASLAHTDMESREAVDRATDAPMYLFDKSRRNSPIVVITPGESNDTSWATDEELAAKDAAETEIARQRAR